MTAHTPSRRSLYPAAFLLALVTVYTGDLLAAAALGRSADEPQRFEAALPSYFGAM